MDNRFFSEGADNIKNKNAKFKAKFDELINAMDMVGFSDEVRHVLDTVINNESLEVDLFCITCIMYVTCCLCLAARKHVHRSVSRVDAG